MKDLKRVRRQIDALDDSILRLLNSRAQLSKRVGQLKTDGNESIFSPDRERALLNRLLKLNKGPLTQDALEAIYREILSYSKSTMRRLRIAYLGPEFTFTHEAARKKFGTSVDYVPSTTIADVFKEVESEQCDYGVVPVENSIEGAVTYTLDMFIQSELQMYDEIYLRIRHHLLSRSDSIKTVKNVYSNPQAIAQCGLWLRTNLPGARPMWVSSTAEAAKLMGHRAGNGAQTAAEFAGKISKNPKEDACIAGLLAADGYKLNVLAKSIEDNPNNTTRFIVIARNQAKPSKNDRTSIVFELHDRIGALYDALLPFRKAKINLTKIESRPSKKRVWSYFFFIDFEGHAQERSVQKALRALRQKCVLLKVLGSYPKAER